jgi:hypothetical protein
MVKTVLFILLFGISLFSLPAFVLADTPTPTTPQTQASTTCPSGRLCLSNPLQQKNLTVPSLIGTIIKAALGIIGSITLLMLVWGGFLWLTSAGNDERIQQGTQTMLWAVIGLAVVFSSYFLLTTYVNLLTGTK